MTRLIISLGIGLSTGYVLAGLWPPVTADPLDSLAHGDPVASVECVCDLQRMQDIEDALQLEREANNLLIAEIEKLESDIGRMAGPESPLQILADGDWFQSAWADLATEEDPVGRRQQLIDAGFDSKRAESILNRGATLHMEALNDHYLDADGQQPLQYLESRLAMRRALREEIGDFEYEQYLAATGQSTAVAVTQVLADSPAQTAGLQVGDVIVDYDGARVFNMIDIADRAQHGDPGKAIIVNIERSGAPMQLVLPRGPLGISGGKPTRD